MVSHGNFVARDFGGDDANNMTMINLMIVALGILFFGIILVGLLFLIRRTRKRRMQQMRTDDSLPQYEDVKRTSNPRRLTIHTKSGDMTGRSSIIYLKDGQPMLANPHSPPHSPDNVPEIHITFPDEQDDQGQHKNGRVVVVRVGDNATVGLEPIDEQLPAYEKESSGQFYAIDMDRIGGLKEKESHY